VLEATLGLLRRWGHHPQIAANGAQALALLQTETFDLALVDHQNIRIKILHMHIS
jgi:DNA-binding response OmpR family regulator